MKGSTGWSLFYLYFSIWCRLFYYFCDINKPNTIKHETIIICLYAFNLVLLYGFLYHYSTIYND